LSPALAYVLGMHPGEVISVVGAMRECGFEVRHRFEDENAAVRHFLIPFVLEHGDDWRMPALAEFERRKAEVSGG
jgi:hypothetical protein